jgi:hypothetical protein
MRRLIGILSVCLLLFATTPSFATSGAHFFNDTSASVDTSTGGLLINIDEAGVGQDLVNYTASFSASATYQCFNNGGKHPKAGNKETVGQTVTANFSEQPQNGRVQTSITISGTPVAQGSFTCPSGQTLFLVDVSYTGTLNDTTNAVSINLSASAQNLFIAIQ